METAVTAALVLGVDSGGSGLRVRLARVAVGAGEPATGTELGTLQSRTPVRTGDGGIDADHLLELLLPMARGLLERAGGGEPAALAVGAAGMATLGARLRAELPGALERSLGVRRLALASDSVTAYAGALGQRPGVVVAAGTGLIAMGTELTRWRRADGWGHLLGDCGGGAWIGRAGLEAALRAHDGRAGGSPALLAAVEERFGSAREVPGALYPRQDRPAVLAAFAPSVARCAGAGDAVSTAILGRAAGHIAEAAEAVCPRDEPERGAAAAPGGGGSAGTADGVAVALTGGLVKLGEPLLVPLEAELTRRLPSARRVAAAGDPLAGAVVVAEALATGTLRLPRDPFLLHLPGEPGSPVGPVGPVDAE
ncbi:N-acetylglucosamine kinase [Streptomyces sp. NPDC057638]|uniref:N-acetylglucosamine kinase n=1 Tax=Streptomyces sp. NPDC057638 TaxID=3346190 RepID=UPI003697575D